MPPQTVRDICDVTTAVDASEVDRLDRVAAALPWLADLASADLTLFCAAQAPPRGLVVLAEGRPTVCQTLYSKPRLGEILEADAEPVVARCVRTGRTHRRGFVALMGGRPVEQTVLPVRRRVGQTVAAVSVERSLLNGPWAAAARTLKEAAADLAACLLGDALDPGDLLSLLRMAQGLTLSEPSGDLLYADDGARLLWRKALPGGRLVDRLPPGPPAGGTVISQREEPWGREWEFEVGSAVFRRRDFPLRPSDPEGRLLTLIQDISHLRAGELLVSARSAAIQEIHHRIKNNLQTISSLLRMQARRETSPRTVESLRTAIGRVLSVAFVHEALSRDGADEVDLKALAGTLLESAVHGAQREGPLLTYAVLGPRLLLPAAKASQVALVLNELVQNSVKHAFPSGRTGGITVRFEPGPDGIAVSVRDDGVGFPSGFDPLKTTSLGLQITRRIVESDLGGTLGITQDGGGSTVLIRLPAVLAHEEAESR